SGNFSAPGIASVRLKGYGKPIDAGTSIFTARFDSTSCPISITVVPSGTPSGGTAQYGLQGTGGNCMNATLHGNYIRGVPVSSTEKIDVQVNVTTPGTYNVTTNTVNGYSFSGTGTFTSTGVQTITLAAFGTPVIEG